MAGTFGDMIWQLAGNQDPTMAMMAAMQAGGQGNTPSPGAATPGAGGMDPATGAPAPTPTPQAYTSPPDLMQMYGELQKQQAFADSMNTGMGLILSGFAHPDNKENIIDAFSGGGGSDSAAGGGGQDPLSFMTGIMKFQQAQQDMQRQAADRANLPAIAKQYGLDEKTATLLYNSGKLDSIIAELEKPNKQITKDENGQSHIVDLATGEVGPAFGTAKARETEIVTDSTTGRQFAVFKDTKEPVGGKDVVEGQRKTEWIDDPSGEGGKVKVYSDDGTPVSAEGGSITKIAAPPPETEYIADPDGKGGQVLVDKKTRQPITDPKAITKIAAPPPETEYIEMADGSKVLVDKRTRKVVTDPQALKMISAPPKKVTFVDDGRGGKKAVYDDGTPVPGKDIPGMGATEKEQLYNASMENHIARGGKAEEFPSLDDWLVKQAEAGSPDINVGPSGIEYGDPPTDMAWKRDKEGKVIVDENGAPIPIPLQGTKLWHEQKEASGKGDNKDWNEVVSASIVGQDIDRAMDNIFRNKDELVGSTGWSSLLDFLPRSEAKQLSGVVATIKANVGLDKLQEMRAANATGAAVGNVSDFENRIMQRTMGDLDLSAKNEDIIYNLRRIRAVYAEVIKPRGAKSATDLEAILAAVPYPTEEELAAEYSGGFSPEKGAAEEKSVDDILKEIEEQEQ